MNIIDYFIGMDLDRVPLDEIVGFYEGDIRFSVSHQVITVPTHDYTVDQCDTRQTIVYYTMFRKNGNGKWTYYSRINHIPLEYSKVIDQESVFLG